MDHTIDAKSALVGGVTSQLIDGTSSTIAEEGELKKARILLKAVIKANPSSESGWVAAARVEELDGKLKEARILLQNACEQFPKSEDIWFEASRL